MNDIDLCLEVKLVTPIRLKRNISKTSSATNFKFGMQLCMGNAEREHTKIPLKVGVA